MQRFASQIVKCALRPGAVKWGCLLSAGVLASSALAQPANDNFGSAQVISGDFGTVTGSNVGATAEPGEPNHAGLKPNASIWYVWTANNTGPVEFDTFNSTCDTVLAVYVGPTVGNATVGNLNQVVANDDINTTNPENANRHFHYNDPYLDNPYLGPSGVKFNAVRGTTYYIAVDGYTKNNSSLPGQGAITLSWAYNPSGVFRVSHPFYFCTEAESDKPVDGSYAESAQGARITVTRVFGSSGKAIVSFDLRDGSARAGVDYKRPDKTTLLFDDHEMSKSFVIPIIDDGSVAVRNPARIGVPNNNRTFSIILTNVVLDAQEDPTVLPAPRFDNNHINSIVEIFDMDIPILLDPTSPTVGITNGVVNFERSVYRVREGVGMARILVYRGFPGTFGLPNAQGTEIHYEIDTTWFPEAFTDDNQFDLQPGSDYAAPSPNNSRPSLNFDFGTTNQLAVDHPDNHGTITDGVGIGTYGTLRWGSAQDFERKEIWIPINDDTIPEFNEDINIFLFQIAGHTQDAELGWNSQCTVTILYDDYPAGGLDDSHNRDWDISTEPANNSAPGADSTVYALAVHTNDNKTVIGGTFGSFNSYPRYGLARMNANGSIDFGFDPGDGIPVKDPINPAFISSLTFTPADHIIIGGNFPSYNGVPRYNIAEVNPDGSLDSTFNPGLGANGTVWAVAVQTNGQVVIGGEFTAVNDFPRLHIARLNTDGSVDPSFDPGTNGPDGTVNAIALAPDGSMYIGGDFSDVNGLFRRSIAQIDTNGIVVPAFSPVTGVDGPVFCLALQPDGKLLVGGSFANSEFRSRNNICRYNPDGTLDITFDPGSGADDSVYSITLQPDGRIFLGGVFNSINQTRRMCVARLFTTGEVDTGFMDTAYNQFAGLHKPYFNPYVNPKDFLFTTGLQTDGNLMIGGSFHYVGGGRFEVNVATNSYAPFDGVAETRAAYRTRYNVARLLGGNTDGPGSMGLVNTNYNVVENMGFLYVKAIRTRGDLGQIEATFSIPPRTGSNTIGVAQSGADYLYTRVNPRYGTTWNGDRELSDGIFGTNNVSISVIPTDGPVRSPLADIYVTVPNIPGYQGDRSAPFKMDVPSYADVFYLGGEDIPLASALAQTKGLMYIQEDDTAPGVIGFSAGSYAVTEGTNAVITLVRTNGSVGPISVRFATTNGTAIAGQDYIGVTNSVLFRDGQTSTNVVVPTLNNSAIQNDLAVNLYLAAPGNGATLGVSNAVLTLINVNFLPGHLNFSSTAYSTNETASAAILTVTRSGGSLGVEDVQYATSNLTAIAGANYSATSGTLHWDSGDTSVRYIMVPLIHDGLVTPNKQFLVTLLNPTVPGSLGIRTQTTVTIINTDFYGTLQFSAANYFINELGGYAAITITRTGGSAETISANFSTADSTAYAFFNYVPTNGTVTFGPGEISKSFTVPILNDGVQDPPNLFGFNLLLSNFSPVGIAGNPTTAFVNIIDAQSFNQQPGQVDTFFDPNAGFNDDVFGIALQPDGKFVVGGNFTIADGQPINRIARLNPDGTLDESFLTTTLVGANDVVRAVVSQTDTRVLVAGAFTTINAVVRNSIARLNYDATLDTGFNPGSGADGPIYALNETFDLTGPRKIYAGGSFNSFNGTIRPALIRLNNDGTVDNTFNTGAGANGTVYAIVAYPTNSPHAGQVLVGGDFTSINNVACGRIARLNSDGSVDTFFNSAGTGADTAVRAIALQTDDRILIGGSFTNINGFALNRIARLNDDGSVDSSFQVGVGADDTVNAITVQPDNRILVVGGFKTASGATRKRITRLMPDGTIDPTINFGTGADNTIASVVLQPDGKILIGGSFTTFEGQPHARIARLYGSSMVGSGTLQFDSATYQANENSTNIVVTVLRTGGTSGPRPDGSGDVAVDFSTSDGTGIAGVNYSNVTATLHFPVGETVQKVTIPLIDDQVVTPNLTVNLALANPTPPATLGAQPTALLTIINVESAVSFASPTYSRAQDAIDGAATVQLVRVGSTQQGCTVVFSTVPGGTAVPGVDYTPVTNTVSFLPGQTVQTAKVPIFNTHIAGPNTTVLMQLTDASGTLLLAPIEAVLTIINVNQAPGQFMFSQTNYVVSEGDGSALITVVRTNGSSGPVSVAFSTLAGDATPGLNYIPTNGVLSYADGESVHSFTVPLINDKVVLGPRTVPLLLSNATGGAVISGPNPVPLTILDDDVGVSFATNSLINAVYIVSETNSLITLDVYRLNTTNGVTTVSYATTNGTATAGVNYIATSGTLTFNPGESHKSISISILRDPRVTGDLSFSVNLFNPTPGVQLASPSTAVVVINDVDSGLSILDTNSPPVANAVFSVRKDATNLVITVIRTNANTGVVSVNYTTLDGTAVAPADYTAVSGSLVFTNGQLSNSFTVPIIDNNVVSGDLYFTVSLFNPTAPAQLLQPNTATVNIIDVNSGFRFSSGNYDVLENGVFAPITVQRVGFSNSIVSVNYATADGTAVAGVDYDSASGTLVFTNGETSKSFAVPVRDKTIIEGDRTVLLSLSSPAPTNSTSLLTPAAATLTIHNNKGSLVIPAGSALISESFSPPNGVIDPGETVTLLFAFRNAAGTNTVNMVATLLETNGISSPSGPQTYGVVVTNGPSVSQPFTFTANGTNGQKIIATFLITDSGRAISTNGGLIVFNFTLGTSTASFAKNELITINDDAPATPYPSFLNVTGVDGVISKTTVSLNNLTHSSPSDIEALLASPANQPVVFLANAGSMSVNGVNLTFDDTAGGPLPQSGQIVSGTFTPSVFSAVAPFPQPAPPPPATRYTNALGAFDGTNPNGKWSLFVQDDVFLDGGAISNGWSLNFTLVHPVIADSDLGVAMFQSAPPIVLGSNVLYTLTVENYGPGSATGVSVIDTLPSPALFVSAAPSQGTARTNGNGTLTWNLGSLDMNATASLTLVIQPTAAVDITNSATVSSVSPDLNPANNTASLAGTVAIPTADLAIGLVAAPSPVLPEQTLTYSITVSNLGPSTAPALTVSDFLPPGVALVSASPAGYTLTGSTLTFTNLGDVGSGGQVSAIIVVQPTGSGTITDTATCSSAVTDPLKLNNTASVKTIVGFIPLSFTHSGNSLVVSWPVDAANYVLETTTNLTPPVIWYPLTNTPPVSINGQNTVSIPIGDGSVFFRLRGQ
ncbi:MAG TPA: Calx-beta domain-containing protein [Verrucomicrobiae bacterium]|nr:Calx-beta domain-containing protein [Verrucomicrobiae bacterium]